MRRMKRSIPALVAVLLSLLLAACVEGDSTETTEAAPGTTDAAPDTTEAETTETTEAEAMDAPEEIVIGNPIAMTGPNNAGAGLSQIPSYDLWVADVNAAGGIYVEEYDQQIPVRIERVDDTSDVGTAVQLTQQMIADENIHFIFPPWGTAFNFAIAQDITDAQTPVIGCTVGSRELVENSSQYPYFYTLLNQYVDQGAALVELLQDVGVETVAIIHHDDLFGIDFNAFVEPALADAGIEVVFSETYPLGVEDLSQTLRGAQDADPDAFLAFSYPPESFLITGQAIEIGFNPDVFMAAVGVAFPPYRDAFGPAAEGIIGTGAWNPNIDVPGAREYFDGHVEMHGAEPDRWASAACYATGQVLQQAIEAAGTLDPVAVKEAMDTTEFDTIVGTFSFENQLNPVYPGQIGQWQDGEFEIVSPTDDRTADPIYPKPPWPEG
ncbi:MAG TPA: amino acid ABC transporter substrate-binding protein [Acidimicrobiia bacterium]|nr:amino acid ABC transporter substrate-binding protein [Acidimicrobiia bacterium]